MRTSVWLEPITKVQTARRLEDFFVGDQGTSSSGGDIVIQNSPEATLAALRDTLPLILHNFPNATVDCVIKDPICFYGPRAPSVLASLSMQPIDEILSRFQSKKDAAGPHYLSFDPVPHFSILDNLAFPLVTGFSIGHNWYTLHIDYGEPLLLRPITRDERYARGIAPALFARPHTEPNLFPRVTSPTARHLLRSWLTRRLNVLFAHLTLPVTFATTAGEYRPDQHWQDMLTVNDIVTLTGMLLTESQPTTTRLLFFDLIDRYCVLHDRAGKPADVLNARFVNELADAIDPALGPLRDAIAADLRDAWASIRESLWNGLLDESHVASADLAIRAPGGREELRLSKDEFATRLLAALRNTTHGYDLRGDQFRHVLLRHNCQLPETVRYLALGLWIAFLSKPSAFWRGRADFDAVRVRRKDVPPPASGS